MNQEHIVKAFDTDLAKIENQIMEMGGLVESQIVDAARALKNRDVELAESVIAKDLEIDAMEAELDGAVVRVLALRQPKAQDLRAVVAVLKVASNLERIGDYAKNIAKRVPILAQSGKIGSATTTLDRMCRVVQTMVNDVLDAYIIKDQDKAEEVRIRDGDVDQMYNTLFRELLTYMMEDPRNITPSTHLLSIAKHIERMGDHTTSIAEQIQYLVSGNLPGSERPTTGNASHLDFNPNLKK
ncbi:MAG: phosphate signaling complex protein PhoU [Rhizobiaceae bacterium]|nr:phosphate signaling complex protein PhoU [Rhizobiaceae bacterium]